MDPKTDKLIRRTTMVGTATAAYFLLTADYGPQENALDPIKRAIESVQLSLKRFIFGQDKKLQENEKEKSKYNDVK
ncbi:uncharacterized protein [Elaeis guineensis]|uniref:LOW QUALITY PROTEIN: uncharacterized protein LOC105054857 n=1 Tax=Elaeis guineensis var. tenera TaxID=51953 RepID=A0A6I9RYV0_ELAGV|nr:LOW QUALITY PROTEIN: uncharacterized protein LOC105054857 [Elaeis guineensis]